MPSARLPKVFLRYPLAGELCVRVRTRQPGQRECVTTGWVSGFATPFFVEGLAERAGCGQRMARWALEDALAYGACELFGADDSATRVELDYAVVLTTAAALADHAEISAYAKRPLLGQRGECSLAACRWTWELRPYPPTTGGMVGWASRLEDEIQWTARLYGEGHPRVRDARDTLAVHLAYWRELAVRGRVGRTLPADELAPLARAAGYEIPSGADLLAFFERRLAALSV